MIVLGLDISKASCGAAIGDASGPPRTLRARFSRPSRGEVFAAYAGWLRELLIIEKPDLVASEAALVLVDRTSAAETTRMLLGMASITEAVCAMRGVRQIDVAAATWRKAFLGHGRPTDPKRAALVMCRGLGWPTDGNHDRAEAAGVWCWAHLYHGQQAAMRRLLSASSVRTMEAH